MLTKKFLSLFLAALMITSVIIIPSYASSEISDEKVYYFNGFAADETYKEVVNALTGTKIKNEEGKDVLRIANASGATDKWGGAFTIASNVSVTPGKYVMEYKVYVSSSNKSAYFASRERAGEVESAALYLNNIRNTTGGTEIFNKGAFNEWITVSVVFNTEANTRDVYINGEAEETSLNLKNFNNYTNLSKLTFKFVGYMVTAGDYADVDYLKLYTPSEKFGAEALSQSYALNEFLLDFNQTVSGLSSEQIIIEGNSVEDITLLDDEKQIYRVKLENNLESAAENVITLSGVKSAIGDTLEDEVILTTRDKQFYIDNLAIEDSYGEISNVTTGNLVLKADVNNELDKEKKATIYAASYDELGFLSKDETVSEEVALTEDSVSVSKPFTVNNSEKLAVFALQSEDIPVPVSGMKQYLIDGTYSEELTFEIPQLASAPTVDAEIDADYQGMTVTVSANEDGVERMAGIVVKYKDALDYVSAGKTENGAVIFNIPLVEENIGEYSVSIGVENCSAVVKKVVEYYSPNYINGQMDTKINSAEANVESGAAFVELLGNYLNLDMEAYGSLDDTSVAFEKLYNLRDEEENKTFAEYQDLVEAFSTAVKMALIYEGKDTAAILSQSDDIPVDELTKQIISEDISTPAKQYITNGLKGKEYALPSDMVEDAKYYAIIGGVAKSEHYKQVRAIINAYGGELGINLSSYNSLKYPENVDKAVQKKEYASLEAFANAVNSAITVQARTEANVSLGSSGSSGGGGGGNRVSSNVKYPTATVSEEENKEEVKEEVPVKIYSDVKANDWFYNDVMWATQEGMFIGTSDTTFSPAMNLTWEQIAIVLKRIGHTLENKNGNADISRGDFAEVLYDFLADKAQYKTRDEWISGTKIFIGDQNGDMMFEKTLTRAECCTVLRRIESK